MPQVTLTLASTNYNLLQLLYGVAGTVGGVVYPNGVISTGSSQGKENCAELTIRNDNLAGNPVNNTFQGDGAMTATNFDVGPLAKGDSYKYGHAGSNSISLAAKFLRSDTPNVKTDIVIAYA